MKPIVSAPASPEITALENENRSLARQAAAEGIVLLENNGVLPLREKEIALYGAGARMTVKGGRGSGEVRNRSSVSIAQGLENAGYRILTQSWLDAFDAYYRDTYEGYRREMEKRVDGIREFFKIQRAITPFMEPNAMPITEKDAVECRTAIYVLSRQAGEGHDRQCEPGDFLLTGTEKENLRFLRAHYRELIVVINAGGMVDLSFLTETPASALIYFTQGGEEGGSALADLISGKVNFSGRLTATWPVKYEDVPSAGTYSSFSAETQEQDYTEGIYVGYRYYDTFGIRPRYAFGYGLSYTSFEIRYQDVLLQKDHITVQATVTNTGSVPGRQVVQLYAGVPFGIGSERKRLIAFGKTGLLNPGESETLSLSFSCRNLSVYEENKSAWMLRAGDYVLCLGSAADETEPVFRLVMEREALLEQCAPICPMNRPVAEITPPPRTGEEYSLPCAALDPWVPETICHTYETTEETADPLVSSLTDEQLVNLVIGGSTRPEVQQVIALGASGTTTGRLWDDCGIPNVILSDGPAGLNLTSHVVQLPDGAVKAARVPQNLEAYKRYLFGFNRIALTSQMVKPEDGTSHYQYATAWPCSMLLAQSFDTELLERVGDGVGREMEAFGVTVWLAPGMNIHRNPLCGRTFEYYSEDPLVSGKMAAAIVRGVQKHPGKGMSVKHFAANSCELERNRSSSNVHERALREIYLRGFEIAVREADPMTVMAAYNRINGLHCVNSYDLLVKVLRNEWGYRGMVMSDWDSMKADPADCTKPLTGDVRKAHAAQCDLVCPGREDQHQALLLGLKDGRVSRHDLERSAVRVLRMVRQNTVLKSK